MIYHYVEKKKIDNPVLSWREIDETIDIKILIIILYKYESWYFYRNWMNIWNWIH